ncbi:MAG: hypothetical protein HC893_11415 [Chloroflexaceae bacterium]|nr:hypothetical protein [Chloroflexaceae bacterium]
MTELAPHAAELPPYPVQNSLTRDIRQEAARQEQPAMMSLWAGQAFPLSTHKPAAAIISEVVAQAEAVLAGLQAEQ